jgi:NADH:ubiquinone oxidoreductase subunit K
MEIFHPGLNHFLGLGAALLGLGLYGIITRKNAFSRLIGIQLILSACNIILVSFSRFEIIGPEGQVLPVFIIIIGSLQILSFASIINKYKNTSRSTETEIID